MIKQTLLSFIVLFSLISGNLIAQGTWQDVSPENVSAGLLRLYQLSNNFYIIKTNSNYYLKSSNQGLTWEKVTLDFNPESYTGYDFGSVKYIYAQKDNGTNYNNAIFKSVNGGITFDTIKIASPLYKWEDLFFTDSLNGFVKSRAIQVSSSINASEYLFKTSNGGVSWDTCYKFRVFSSSIGGGSSYERNYFRTFNIRSYNIGFAPLVEQFSSFSGTTYYSRLMKTTNSGLTWDTASPRVLASYGTVFYSDSSWAYFAGNQGLYRYKGNGIPVDSISGFGGGYFFKNRKEGFNYSGNFLRFTTDSLKTWSSISMGHDIQNVNFINDNLGFILTNDGKIYRTTDGGAISGVSQISSEVLEKFSLSQNYPNPFNPSTKINYEIKSSGFVSLKVFDLLGKEVATLVNEKQNAGSYVVDFNSTEFNLPSGIYFYTLNAGEFKETRKMVLVK